MSRPLIHNPLKRQVNSAIMNYHINDINIIIGESISGLYETLRNKGYYKVLQEDLLKKNVCPKLSDPTECQSNINKFWRYMTEGLFSDETATGLCAALIPYGVNCDAER